MLWLNRAPHRDIVSKPLLPPMSTQSHGQAIRRGVVRWKHRRRSQSADTPMTSDPPSSDSEAGSESKQSSNTNTRKIWIVMDHRHAISDPTDKRFTRFAGAFATLEFAKSKMRQIVRRWPPTKAEVEAFLADDANWVEVRDNLFAARGMGYQYTMKRYEHLAVWVEEAEVEGEMVGEFVGEEYAAEEEEEVFGEERPYVPGVHDWPGGGVM